MEIKPIGSYDNGQIQVCEKCNYHNFYVNLPAITDICGPMPNSFIFDQKLDPNTFEITTVWCRSCDHSQESSYTTKAIRFVCPDCDKVNVHAIEPKKIHHDVGDRYIYYSSTETECLYCNSKFKQMSIINGKDTPDWWITQHLWRFDDKPAVT